MNLDTKEWKPFYLKNLYDIQMGNGFDKNKLDEADKKFKDDSAKVKENLKNTQSRLDNREENLKIAKDTYEKAMHPEVQKNVKTEVRKAPTGMKK